MDLVKVIETRDSLRAISDMFTFDMDRYCTIISAIVELNKLIELMETMGEG